MVLSATALMVAPATAAYAQTTPTIDAGFQPAVASVGSYALPTAETYVGYYDVNTNLCLNLNSDGSVGTASCPLGANGFPVGTTGANQEWAYYMTGYGATLQSADQVNQTNLCLDSNYAANVYTSPCDGDDTFQDWSWGGQGTAFTIQNYQTGLCLDSNSSGNLYTNPCNWNDNYQNWVPIF
jgi:hypothetical protein